MFVIWPLESFLEMENLHYTHKVKNWEKFLETSSETTEPSEKKCMEYSFYDLL